MFDAAIPCAARVSDVLLRPPSTFGTEELGHLEMVAAIVHQLTRNLTDEQVKADPGFAAYFVDHTAGVYPTAASGFPWSAASIQSTGDVIADLTEDLAAEQKARKTKPFVICSGSFIDSSVTNLSWNPITFLVHRNFSEGGFKPFCGISIFCCKKLICHRKKFFQRFLKIYPKYL